ncbi:FAD-binding oxidoreductase [Burkholderia sp. IDO3]|uniref:NAD(P)/FAD-dependent oxidoreductase n=1 Tax=Burkholderia sp. IDO3 TaxID=1705310 RepID=UPI000BBAF04B|nr:FAD-binding oxidoreductase [Burkholderia sp. IDO3]AXK67488.1 FAD-binding oxidoreductase [Burkholderia sp. IDO3]PCD60120.1 FAD-dependent oxidoreductase [Burkholderia sp. IDO3]
MFVASKLPQHLGKSGWVEMLPPRAPRAPLTATVNADIAIIGGGFAGLSAARRLSQLDPGLKVVVLEAGEVAEGATGRNSGFIIDLPHEVSSEDYGGSDSDARRHDIQVHRMAIALARDLALEKGWGKDVFDPCGKYNVAMGPQGDKHVSSYAVQLNKANEPYRLLNAREIAAVTGTKSFTSAIFTPGTVMIQPAAYVRGLADSFRDPVTLFENTPALSMERQGAAWRIKTPNGAVNAGKIILANNGHAQSFGLLPGVLLHVYTYASMSKAFDPSQLGGERSWAATPAFPMGTTVRRVRGDDGDRILIRSRYTYNPRLQVTEGAIARAGRVHDRKFDARFPMLKGLPMQYRWAGAMALTWNGVPAFGEIEPGIFAAIACNGVGATKATASGIAAAEAALGMDSWLVQVFRGFAAPKRLPPQPFLTIGATANLSVKEWSAGLE